MILVAITWFGLISAAIAAPTWKVSLKDADIRVFISQVADMTQRSFIVDPRVKTKVTVMSTAQMNADEVYELFLSVLAVHGYAAVPAGEFTKIVPAAGVKTDSLPLQNGVKGSSQELVTRVIQVKNTPALELIPILRPMVPQYGHLAGVVSANALIISDHQDNIARIEQIIQKLDAAESEEYELIQLKHGWVGTVVELLASLTPIDTGDSAKKPGNGAVARVKVVADERSNRLIISGEPSARKRIRKLVQELDTEGNKSGSTKVIRLRHAEAPQVAEMLQNLLAQGTGARSGKNDEPIAQDIQIQADETQNALVVRGEPSDLSVVEDIVRQLDTRRSQVLIEAAVVEVSGDVGQALGVQWAAIDQDLSTPLAGINFSNLGTNLNSVISALTTGVPTAGLGDGITIAGGERSSDGRSGYGALVQALANASNTNLLSTPSIMTLDNQEAEIVVGQNVPFITGSTTTGQAGSINPFQTITREDVGLTLQVTPQISEGDVVRLEVLQEVSAVVPSAEGINSADLITNKRSIRTTILADEGETIVLGGLIQDDFTDSESKVPILGDIPLLGRLFKSQRRSRVKRNLLVFLRPSIIRDGKQLRKITQRKYQHIREIELDVSDDGIFRLVGVKDGVELPANIDEVYSAPSSEIEDERRPEEVQEQRDESTTSSSQSRIIDNSAPAVNDEPAEQAAPADPPQVFRPRGGYR